MPPLPRAGERADGLTPGQRGAMTAGIVAVHALVVYGLLQVQEVRDAAHEVAPMFVDLIAPSAPPAPPPPPPPPPPRPQPVPKRVTPAPVLAAAPSPATTTFAVPEQAPPEPAQPPAPPAAIVAPPAPAPAVVAAPQPRVIAASDVQYLERPTAEYPRLSVRNGEAGRVIVLVLIDERGMPQQVQIAKSSGFARLDASALTAVRGARFRPPTDNGRAVSGWTNVPFDFGLEK